MLEKLPVLKSSPLVMQWEQRQLRDLLGWVRMLRDSASHLLCREHRGGGNTDPQVLTSPLKNVSHFAFVSDTQQKTIETKREGVSESEVLLGQMSSVNLHVQKAKGLSHSF